MADCVTVVYLNTNGCLQTLPQGDYGQILATGAGGCVSWVTASTLVTTKDGIQGDGSAANPIQENFDNLPAAAATLPVTTGIVVANDGANNDGSLATPSGLAALLSPFLPGGAPIYGKRPWAVINGANTPTSADDVLMTDDIVHTGDLFRGSLAARSSGVEFENRANFANGAGNHAVSNGTNNLLNGIALTVSGNHNLVSGNSNQILVSGIANTIAGGNDNTQTAGTLSFIGAGQHNNIYYGEYSGIVAGISNRIDLNLGGTAVIQGAGILAGSTNKVRSPFAGIGVGQNNLVANTSTDSFIAGGENNQISNVDAFVGAGDGNNVTGARGAVVAGNGNGINNSVTDAFVGAGTTNQISVFGSRSFIGAGNLQSVLSPDGATVAGDRNSVGLNSNRAFIAAGQQNNIQNAPDSYAIGSWHTIQTAGQGSGALGTYTQINHSGVFLWHANDLLNQLISVRNNEFAAGGAGGFRLRTNAALTVGVDLPPGANAWVAVSSKAMKGQFQDVDPRDVLKRLLSVPMTTYRFKDGEDYHEHINLGPSAEDWNTSFGDLLGEKHIVNVVHGFPKNIPAISEGDKMGVALTAIQGLKLELEDVRGELSRRFVADSIINLVGQRVSEKKAEVAPVDLTPLTTDIAALRSELAGLVLKNDLASVVNDKLTKAQADKGAVAEIQALRDELSTVKVSFDELKAELANLVLKNEMANAVVKRLNTKRKRD